MFINAFSHSFKGMASFSGKKQRGKISFVPFPNWLMAHLSSTSPQRMVRFFARILA